jgi:hypothetical protein
VVAGSAAGTAGPAHLADEPEVDAGRFGLALLAL